MQKWEYKIVSTLTEDSLNELGEQGWELVALYDYYYAYLKRPKN